METKTAERKKPVTDFKSTLFYLQQSHIDLAASQKKVEETKKAAGEAFFAARHAAKEMGQTLPTRYMCGQWLFEFAENGNVKVTEIPNHEPFHLLNIAEAMGEVDDK